MRLRLTGHGRQRLLQRGISEDDVREALGNWHTTMPCTTAPVCYIGRLSDGRELQVCLSDTVDTDGVVKLITAFVRSQPQEEGLTSNG